MTPFLQILRRSEEKVSVSQPLRLQKTALLHPKEKTQGPRKTDGDEPRRASCRKTCCLEKT